MDPVTHTLVGANLARTGLGRRTALGTATLLIAANFPDMDVASYAWGPETALWFRRGITHGLPALAVLPFLLTGVIWAWDRVVRRRGGQVPESPVRPKQVLLLSFVGMVTHPLLDFLNVYGMRWLVPFDGTWTYGDAVFIMDPWMWAVLAAGVWLSRQRNRAEIGDGRSRRMRDRWPAALALAAFAAYAVGMGAAGVLARGVVVRSFADRGVELAHLMVAPVPVNPVARWVVAEDREGRYHVGRYTWLAPDTFEPQATGLERHPSNPAASAAVRGPAPRRFMSWARFPYFRVTTTDGGYLVYIGDARYTLDPAASWAATVVNLSTDPGAAPP